MGSAARMAGDNLTMEGATMLGPVCPEGFDSSSSFMATLYSALLSFMAVLCGVCRMQIVLGIASQCGVGSRTPRGQSKREGKKICFACQNRFGNVRRSEIQTKIQTKTLFLAWHFHSMKHGSLIGHYLHRNFATYLTMIFSFKKAKSTRSKHSVSFLAHT